MAGALLRHFERRQRCALSCIARSWPPPPKPRPRPPPRERLRRRQRRSTSASTAIAPSVAANIAVDMSDRVSLFDCVFIFVTSRRRGAQLPLLALQGHAPKDHATFHPAIYPTQQPPFYRPSLTFANIFIIQTPRSVRSSARNARVPSSVAISCSATTEPCMPKMGECLFSLKGGKEQTLQRHRPRTQSPPSTSIRARWSR